MLALLIRWLLAHDATPDGNSDGLFAFREAQKGQTRQKKKWRSDPKSFDAM